MDIMEMMMNNKYLAMQVHEDFNKAILSMMIHYDMIPTEKYDVEFQEFEFNQFATFVARDLETNELFRGFSFPKAIILDEQTMDFMRNVNDIHGFNILEWSEENEIDLLVAINMFSILHEVGHIFNSINMAEIDENKDEMLEELENSGLSDEEIELAYRQLPFEYYADLFATDMMNIYANELKMIFNHFKEDMDFGVVEFEQSACVEG